MRRCLVFDRLLIAQAGCEQLEVITGDAHFSAYPGIRILW